MLKESLGLTLLSLPHYNNSDGFTIPSNPSTKEINFSGTIDSPTTVYSNRMLNSILVDFHVTPTTSFEVYVMIGQYVLGETAWQPYSIIRTIAGVSRYSVDMYHFIDTPAVLTMFSENTYTAGKVTLTLEYIDNYSGSDRTSCSILTFLEFDNTYYGDSITHDISDGFYTKMKLISVGTRTTQPEIFVKNQNGGVLLRLKAPLVSSISSYELNTYLTQITLSSLVDYVPSPPPIPGGDVELPPSPPAPGVPRPYPQRYTGVLYYKV
jgi:hypothetical protein